MSRVKKLIDVKQTRERKKVCSPAEEFVFRLPDGRQVGRAKDIVEFVERLKSVPLQSVLYHANGNHFGSWLEFIGESGAAKRIASVHGDGEEFRKALLSRI